MLSTRNYEVKLSPLLPATEFNSALVRKPFCINLFLANVINRSALKSVRVRVYDYRLVIYRTRMNICHGEIRASNNISRWLARLNLHATLDSMGDLKTSARVRKSLEKNTGSESEIGSERIIFS